MTDDQGDDVTAQDARVVLEHYPILPPDPMDLPTEVPAGPVDESAIA